MKSGNGAQLGPLLLAAVERNRVAGASPVSRQLRGQRAVRHSLPSLCSDSCSLPLAALQRFQTQKKHFSRYFFCTIGFFFAPILPFLLFPPRSFLRFSTSLPRRNEDSVRGENGGLVIGSKAFQSRTMKGVLSRYICLITGSGRSTVSCINTDPNVYQCTERCMFPAADDSGVSLIICRRVGCSPDRLCNKTIRVVGSHLAGHFHPAVVL